MGLMIDWIGPIREKVGTWTSRWHGDLSQRPQLYFKENSTVVYDSRSARPVEHEVGEVGKQVLEFLSNKPGRIGTLTAGLPNLSDIDFSKEVDSLRDRGLVFEEGERYMSLVLPREYPPVTRLE